MRHRPLQHDVRVNAHQLAVVMGVAVAGARRPRLDVAHHRAGIAADLVVGSSRRISQHEQALEASVKLSDGQMVTTRRQRSSGGVPKIASLAAAGPFVRIQMMLRAWRNAVKRSWKRKTLLPIKRAG